MFVNYYVVLGIEKNATEDQIKKAYRLNAIKFHPDKNFSDEYFSDKFISIKNAYDILIDINKRHAFDLEYEEYFFKYYKEKKNSSDEKRSDNLNKEEVGREEEFRYNPHKQFYSVHDREQQETPQVNPIYDFFGKKLLEGWDFFKLPKNIGKIVSGFSDLKKTKKPYSPVQKAKRVFIGILIGLLFGSTVYFLANLTNPIWIIIWFVVPSTALGAFADSSNKFFHTNLYVGINGFAEFVCNESRENLIKSFEINFGEITDLYNYQVDYSRNYIYQKTQYLYIWLNRDTGKIPYFKEGTYNKKWDIEIQPIILNFFRSVEKYWTIYLLDKLEDDIQRLGHITFCLYSHKENLYQEYIRLGVGKITFVKNKGENFTYNFNEIKKIYTKGNELRIVHKNFEKVMFFFKSGNEDVIPLAHLCNRMFFLKALDILLGYKIG